MKDIYRFSFHLYYLINLFSQYKKPFFLPKSLPEINLFFLLVKKDYFLLSIYLDLFNKGPEIFFVLPEVFCKVKKYYSEDNVFVPWPWPSRHRPVTVPSPFFRTPSPLRPPCVPRIQRSFSVPKRPLIFDRSIAF